MKKRKLIKHDKNLRKTAKQSTRYPFIAEHRGGPLTKDNHRRLIKWARECSEHVFFLIEKDIDKRLIYALDVARKWENGDVPTGVAMKACLGAHEVARQVKDPIYKAIARSVGQAVATAHMADHSLGGAFYALKAIKLANKDVEKEKDWQNRKLNELPSELIDIVQAMWNKKELNRRI